MNGLQIIERCTEVARRQYEGEPEIERVKFELELLRTKVLELARKLEAAAQCFELDATHH